jgi:probable HAF family extracellular repeat protein
MINLGTLPGDVVSVALSINNRTQVVGLSFDASGNVRPVLWQNGGITDLNILIPAGSPLSLLETLGTNDRGQITGYALVIATGEIHGFLATPCGEGDDNCGKGVGENAMPQTSPAVRNASTPTLPQSFLRRMDRYRFPGPAFGPMN